MIQAATAGPARAPRRSKRMQSGPAPALASEAPLRLSDARGHLMRPPLQTSLAGPKHLAHSAPEFCASSSGTHAVEALETGVKARSCSKATRVRAECWMPKIVLLRMRDWSMPQLLWKWHLPNCSTATPPAPTLSGWNTMRSSTTNLSPKGISWEMPEDSMLIVGLALSSNRSGGATEIR